MRLTAAANLSQCLKRPHPISAVVQVENDVYCTYANRANFEAKYAPVPRSTDPSTLAGV